MMEYETCPRCKRQTLKRTYNLLFCMGDNCTYQDGWETFDDMSNDNQDVEID